MYKIKMTIKEATNTNNKIIKVGYCQAWHLLKGVEPIGYNSGVYGWNWDLYEITHTKTGEGLTICTGYRSTIGEFIDYKTINKYEAQARKIYKNYELGYKQQLKRIEKLRDKFINEILNIK